MLEVHIGLDDFDSPLSGCTTYIASLLVEVLDKENWINFIDYPNLVRLNPNIPFKTRGNGAVALRLKIPSNKAYELLELLKNFVNQLPWSDHGKTDPVIAVLFGNIPNKLRWLYHKALTTVVPLDLATKIARRLNVKVIKRKKGRGLIGALAAIGWSLQSDFTFELLTYREKSMWGKERKIDEKSVIEFDRVTRPYTFNNIDFSTGRILITPRGPDPVLYGVRGENPEILLKALEIIKTYEEIDRWLLFRTNQGTDSHLTIIKKISEIRPYDSVGVIGKLVEDPKILMGGHVKLVVSDETGTLECMVYHETGFLNKVARLLRKGDIVEVWGGVKPKSPSHKLTLNVEKIKIIKIKQTIKLKNPKCPICGKSLKSLGKGKGFKCKKCGFKTKELSKVKIIVPRIIEPGVYIASPKAHRHLTKPMIRIGLLRKCKVYSLIQPWHMP